MGSLNRHTTATRVGFAQADEIASRRRLMNQTREARTEATRRVCRGRTLFLSDVHLATRSCRAELLLDFLQHNDAGTIYMVGDIVDFSRIKRSAVWPTSHGEVLQALLPKMCGGT